ncbi:MAG: response regulator [Clostridium sp.]|nr:response regulator [Clostridium sp.]
MANILKVMLVDDEVTILEGFKRLFDWEAYGCKVVCEACDGVMAVNQAKAYKPDIIIMDINIPVMSGLEALRLIREQNKECACIIVSGYDEFDYCREALRLQITDYILKPVDFAEFGKVIESIKLKLIQNKCENTEDREDKLVFQLAGWLSKHLAEDISLQSMAEEFHMNSSYISQLFKNELGMKYHDYLTKLRMDRAKTLLASTGKSISEISGEVGFRDYRVFTKVFKSVEGESPSVFRNNFRGG